jgi:hypothetical protein
VDADTDADTDSDSDADSGSLFITHANTDIDAIPEAAINAAEAELQIAYQHTSHGSRSSAA